MECVNKERHAKYAERGGARTGIENLWLKSTYFINRATNNIK